MPADPDDLIVETLVARLKNRREQQGLSKYRVGQISGLHQSSIGKIEAGQQSPTLFTLLKIARALDVTLSALLAEAEEGS